MSAPATSEITMKASSPVAQLPPPLQVLPDMPPMWNDVEEDFDTAAPKSRVAVRPEWSFHFVSVASLVAGLP